MNTYKTLAPYLKTQMKQEYLQLKKRLLKMSSEDLIPYTNFRLWYSYASKPDGEKDLPEYKKQVAAYQHDIYLERQKRAVYVLRDSYDALAIRKINFLSVAASCEFAGAVIYTGDGKDSRKEAYGLYPEEGTMSGFSQILNSNASARKWIFSKLDEYLENNQKTISSAAPESVPELCRAVFGDGGIGTETNTGIPAFSGNLVEILLMFERNGARFEKQDSGGTITF